MSKIFTTLFIVGFSIQCATAQFIITGPSPDSVCMGDTAMFSVTIALMPDSIRWQYADSPVGPWSSPIIGTDRVDTTQIRVFDSQSYNHKLFRIIVWNGGAIVDSSGNASLTVNPLPIALISPSGPTTFCQGNSIILTASSANSYLWSTNETTASITVSTSQDYYVTVTGGNGCSASSSATTVIVNPLPIALITPSGATTFCQGNSITLTASSAASYKWSSGETIQSIPVSTSGSYWVTVTGVNGCSATSSVTTVVVYPLPNAIISPSGATTFCEGNSITLTANSANSFVWSTGELMQSITVSTAGSYWVTVTNGNGCSATSSITTITINPNPNADFISSPPLTNIKETENIQFEDNSSAPMPTISLKRWEWNFGECSSVLPIEFGVPTTPPVVSYTCPGLKTVCLKVTDSNTCFDDTCATFEVNPADAPIVSVSLKGFPPKCLGDEIVLEATAVNSSPVNFTFSSFKWDVIGTPSTDYMKTVNIISPSNTARIEQCTLKFSKPGNYTIRVTATQIFNINPDSMLIGQQDIVINSGSIMPFIDQFQTYIPPSICENSSDTIKLVFNTNNDTKVDYNLNGELHSGNSINGKILIPVIGQSNINEIIFNISYIEQIGNECKNSSPDFTKSIIVKKAPLLSVLGDTILCKGLPGTLIVSGADSDKYIWKLNGTDTVSTSETLLIPTQTIGTLKYIVEGKKDGCTSKKSINVEVRQPPNPLIAGDQNVCIGQVVSYASNSTSGNIWNTIDGNILGSKTESQIFVIWNTSGSLKLIQRIGDCTDSTSISINVSGISPPYDTLVYLDGGGILIYPNPTLKQGLCYKWYKDGLLLPDTYQGCVVGSNLPDSELNRYSVKVYYCGQDTGCAQLITYRAADQVLVPTEFHLLAVPNPNSGDFSLQYEIPDTGNYIQYLFDSSGRVLRKETIVLKDHTGMINISLTNVASGIYFVKLINTATGEYHVVPVSIIF